MTEFTPMNILLKTIFLILRKRPLVTSIGEKFMARPAGTIPDISPTIRAIAIIIGIERHVSPISDISKGVSIIPITLFKAGVTATMSSMAPNVHIVLISRLSLRCWRSISPFCAPTSLIVAISLLRFAVWANERLI